MFCKHDFVILESYEMESQAEQLHEMGLRPNTYTNFIKKHVTILKCTKCSRIKKIIVSN